MKVAIVICLTALICIADGASIEKLDKSVKGLEHDGNVWRLAINSIVKNGNVGCIQPHFSCSYDKQEECCSGRCYRKEYAFFCA